MLTVIRDALSPYIRPTPDAETARHIRRALRRLGHAGPSGVPTVASDRIRRLGFVLRHPLSQELVQRYGWPARCPTASAAECEALDRWSAGHALSQHISVERLTALNAALCPGSAGRRGGAAMLRGGNGAILLCSPEAGLANYRLLAARPVQAAPVDRFVDAVVELVCLNNYHLFRDGNGRVSRAVFNHRMRGLGLPQGAYLPLKECFWHSRGGYEIRLRIAELEGGWNPLLTYFADALCVLLPVRRPALAAGFAGRQGMASLG